MANINDGDNIPANIPQDIPPHGKLEEGITEDLLFDAIRKSGYPFQAEVSNKIASELNKMSLSFNIQEEWVYVDGDSNSPRSLDIFAEIALPSGEDDLNEKGSRPTRIRPFINLLIECKQSSLPYVFFLRDSATTSKVRYPEMVGLPHKNLRIFGAPEEYSEGFSFCMPIHDLLGSYELISCNIPAPFAVSFAKAVRKGAKLELTGEETYRSITLPPMKAADYLKGQYSLNPKHKFFSLRFLVCIAVVRAPMIGTYLHEGRSILVSMPWVRTGRMGPAAPEDNFGANTLRYFDIVHDYLSTYLDVILKDLRELARRAVSISDPLADGHAITVGRGDPPISLFKNYPRIGKNI
ncbi:hypothetical protein [Thermomonospora cellulosilytica]|uniref:Uncharacterized protein n=1 Tax=Thermomonospora cellulosilytica TaxID=1411118 RepID=A0A7W3MYY9_9ACTN|nr:hypothetical protein [Thermomonospora cellulosilytica]MBA9004479.1 hypothetical protein [Thermomonospora cellulosilytica]